MFKKVLTLLLAFLAIITLSPTLSKNVTGEGAVGYYKAIVQLTDETNAPISLENTLCTVQYKDASRNNKLYSTDKYDWKIQVIGSELHISIKEKDNLIFYIGGSTKYGQIYASGLIRASDLSLEKAYINIIKLNELCKLDIKCSFPGDEEGKCTLNVSPISYKDYKPLRFTHSWDQNTGKVDEKLFVTAGNYDITANWVANSDENNVFVYKFEDIDIIKNQTIEYHPDLSELKKYEFSIYPIFREYHYLSYGIYGDGISAEVKNHYSEDIDFEIYLSPNINKAELLMGLQLTNNSRFSIRIILNRIKENNTLGKNISISQVRIYNFEEQCIYGGLNDDAGSIFIFGSDYSPATTYMEIIDNKSNKVIRSLKFHNELETVKFDLPLGEYTAKVYPNDFSMGINYYSTFRLIVSSQDNEKSYLFQFLNKECYMTDVKLDERYLNCVMYIDNHFDESNEYKLFLVSEPSKVTGLLNELSVSNPDARILEKCKLTYARNLNAKIDIEYLKRNSKAAILIYKNNFLVNIISLDKYHNFGDVSGHWAEGSIKSLIAKYAALGWDEHNFYPDMNITRAEFAAVLSNVLELPDLAENRFFSDVTVEHPQYELIMKAVENGIINGYPNGTFKPDDFISRQDAAMIIRNAFVIKGISIDSDFDLTEYVDKDKISSYALGAMKLCMLKGIINGFPGKRIGPNENMTRAEATVIIERLIEVFRFGMQ